MRTEQEIREKMNSLREVANDIRSRSNLLFLKLGNGVGKLPLKEMEEINAEIHLMRNQAFEILANANAMKWCIGEIDDIEFATNTATSIIESAEGL